MLALACSAALAQAPKGAGPRGGGVFGFGGMPGSSAEMWGRLLRLEEVQKELELNDDQKAKLKEIGEKALARMKEAFSGMQGFRDLSADERRAKMAELGNKARQQAEELRKEIEGVLVPHQVERIKQIALQVAVRTRGAASVILDDREVQEALGLSEEQRGKLKAIRESMAEKLQKLFRERGEGDQQARRDQFQSVRKEAEQQVLEVVTPEQKEKFEKMQGEKFDVDLSKLAPRGRGAFGKGQPPAKQ